MDVIALVGPSGTGKSHRALMVARRHQADAIIDDGILIQNSKIMAVRRAIFVLPGHAEEVSAAIERIQPTRILILGTSENMVHKIAKRLKLPELSHIIHIEDIATKTEMDKARTYRLKQGKHIIPVPTIELKPHFSGYLIDPLQSFFKHRHNNSRPQGEKTIVRPVFSYYGKLVIDDSTIKSIVQRVVSGKDYVSKIGSVHIHRLREGNEEQGIDISCELILNYGSHIPSLIKRTQEMVRDAVEYMTGMVVNEINIMVKALYVRPLAN